MPTQIGYDGRGKFYRWGKSGKKYYTDKHGDSEAKTLADRQGQAIYGSGYEKNDLDILKSNGSIIEICDINESNKTNEKAGRSKLTMVAHEIYQDKNQWNDNGLTWLEEYVVNNLESAINMAIVVDFIDKEEKDMPSGHGDMYHNEDGEICFKGESPGTVYEAYISDVEINGEIKRAMVVEAYIYKQRYDNFVKYLKEEKQNTIIHGSVEINGKSDSKKIEYANNHVNEDGSKRNGRQPSIFDYTGLAILSELVEPADKTSQLLEISSTENIKNNEIGGQDMENKELIAKVEELSTQVTELNSKIEELNSTHAEKDNQLTEKEAKIAELNEVIVNVNKSLEESNAKYAEIETEVNAYREEKAKTEADAKLAEVNSYFENEIPKNKFNEEEINSLKEYVEKIDLEGLKSAEASLIVKKVKEGKLAIAEETNEKNEIENENNVFFYTKQETKRDNDEEIKLYN